MISDYANSVGPDGTPRGGRGARRRYRAELRSAAEERQATFDAEVAQVGHEQNITEPEARRILNARKRFEHRRAAQNTPRP